MSRFRAQWLPLLFLAGTIGLFAWWTASAGRRLAGPEPRGDFRHFYWAAQAVDEGGSLYTAERESYIYPPLFAFLLVPLGRMPYRAAGALFLALNVALTAGALLLALREGCRRLEIAWDRRVAAAGTFLSLLVLADACRAELVLGQSDTWILMSVVLALVWLERWPVAAGAVLGFAANIKYQTLVFLPFLLVRRRFRAAGGLAAAAVLFALLPAVARGWDRNLDDLRIATGGLAASAGAGEAGIHVNDVRWYLSVSLTSTLARAFVPPEAGAPRLLLLVAAAAGLILLGVVLVYRRFGVRFRTGGPPFVEGLGVIVALLLFSTATTKRHLFLALPVVAASVLLLLRARVPRRPLLAGVVVFGLAMVLPPNLETGEGAARVWKEIGGPSWGLLVLFFTFLWTALGHLRREEPAP